MACMPAIDLKLVFALDWKAKSYCGWVDFKILTMIDPNYNFLQFSQTLSFPWNFRS